MSFAPKQFIRSVDFLSTENAINTSTGCVNIYGGMSVSKDSYLTNMIVVGNSTLANINITGNLITSTGNTLTSSQWTSIDSNTDIYFGTSANSFVGIGTTTPGFNLDISGGSRITGGLTVGNLNVNTGASVTNILNTTICTGTVIVTAGSINAGFNSHTVGSLVTTGGNVGIGTTLPSKTLHVSSSSDLPIRVDSTSTANNSGIAIGSNSSIGYGGSTHSNQLVRNRQFLYSANDIVFLSSNSTSAAMFIQTSGNIGIGTTSPGSKLEVNGTIKSGDITVGNINFTGNLFQNGSAYLGSQWTTTSGNTLTYTSGNVSINSGFTSSFNSNTLGNIFTTGGNVGIGTTSPVYTLDIIGTIDATTYTGGIVSVTSITTGTIRVTGNADITDLTGTNITSGTIRASSLISTSNLSTNNFSSGTIRATTLITSANIASSNLTSTNVLATNITTSILNATTVASTIVSATTFTGGNLSLSGNLNVAGTLTTVNITSTNLVNTNVSAGVVVASTLLSATANSNTLGNIFTTSGNVGIGTTSPQYKLDVNGILNATYLRVNTTLFAANTSGVNGLIKLYNVSNLEGGSGCNITTSTLLATTGITSAAILVTGLTNIASTSNNYSITSGSLNVSGDIVLSGTELMFTQTGASPPTLNGRSSGTKIVLYPSTASTQGDYSLGIEGANMWFQVPTLTNTGYKFYQGTTPSFIISSGGNVGINTTSPSRMLSLNGPTTSLTAGPHLWITTSDQTNPVFQMLNWSANNVSMNFDMYYDGAFRNSGSSTAWQLYKINNQLKFMYQNGTAGTSNGQSNALILASTGNVGIMLGNGLNFNSGSSINNGAYSLHTVNASPYPVRLSMSSDGAVQRPFEIGYYTGDVTSGSWNSKFYVNGYSGNTGIGTASPAYTLDVAGTTKITNTSSTSMGTLIVAGPNSSAPATATSGQLASFYGAGGTGSISNIDLSTYLPGTSTNNLPAVRFSMLDLGAANSTFNILTRNGGSTGTMGSKIFIDGSGNIGMATTSPRSNLEINGTTSTVGMMLYSGNDTGINSIFFNHSNTTSQYLKTAIQTQALGTNQSARSHFGILVNTTGDTSNVSWSDSKFFIHGSSGNIGIRTTAPTDFMQVSTVMLLASTGNLTCSGDLYAFGTISDQRLKTNIENIDTDIALNTINQLRPVTFTWKDDIFNEQKRGQQDIGFIAQEVEELIPYAVGEYTNIESGEVYKNMKHERIIPYLTSAIQRLTSRLASLEEQLKSLKT
jgi:hypothetical protein